MTFQSKLFAALLLAIFAFSCTPKTPKTVTEPVTQTPTPPTPPPTDLSPCKKFQDLPYQEKDDTENQYVIYRDMLKNDEIEEAFKRWKTVYEKAPAADGQRNTVYLDGIYFYEVFISQTQDSTKINEYIDEIFKLYDETERCYPGAENYAGARKGFDLFYKYPNRSSKEETFELLRTAAEKGGDDMPYFIMNPFGALLVDMHYEEKITDEEAKKYVQMLNDALKKQTEECKGSDCDLYKEIKGYLPERLEYFERVKGFYDCAYFTEKYYPEYQASPGDCDNVLTVLSRLKFGGCTEANSPEYNEIYQKYQTDCRVAQNPCYDLLRDANYTEALDCFKTKAADETDPEKKAKYTMLVAKIYYAHLKNFSQARRYALEAADLKGGWGEPYLLIGRMYASSGPLCGSGRGWNSQVVVWTALDMWYKAKSIDPSSAAEANKFINQYSQYMPSKEDIFIRSLKVGDTYFVPCWIQRSTKIRASDG